MSQLSERLCLDLPDAFAGDSKALAYFFQRVLTPILQPKPHLEAFCGRERSGVPGESRGAEAGVRSRNPERSEGSNPSLHREMLSIFWIGWDV